MKKELIGRVLTAAVIAHDTYTIVAESRVIKSILS